MNPHTTLTAARRELADAQAAGARAEQTVRSAEAALAALAESDEMNIGRHADRLESWLRAGHTGTPPSLVGDDRQQQARVTAEQTLAAAQRALASLRTDEARAQAAVQQAEQQLAALRDRAKQAEVARIVARLAALRAEELILAAKLFTVDAFATSCTLLDRAAEAALNDPPPRPTSNVLGGGLVRHDINTSIAGDAASCAEARVFWSAYEQQHDQPAEAAAA
ncbi:MAG: hypothetical protein JSS29_11040 [Proteobacteria bacterium]|nr:hypothetical protein [Pseudomonadota bacterium]